MEYLITCYNSVLIIIYHLQTTGRPTLSRHLANIYENRKLHSAAAKGRHCLTQRWSVCLQRCHCLGIFPRSWEFGNQLGI